MYRDTVTLFNYYNGKWYPTVLNNVDLNADRAAILARYGATSSDRARLHVTYQLTADGEINIGGNKYVKPENYSGEAGTITFASGNLFSFFSSFAWDGEAVISDDAYMQGFYNYLNSLSGEVYAVSSVAMYSVIPHFEVMGK